MTESRGKPTLTKSRSLIFLSLLPILTFFQTGTTVSAADGSVVKVADYGASGDGKTDDTAAIQAAINTAASGDTVLIPDGIFIITRAIELKPDIKISGASQSNSIIRFEGESTSSLINLAGASNVELTSLTLDGNMKDIANGIYAENGSGHKLHRLTIQNLVHSGFGPHGILFTGNLRREEAVTHSLVADNIFLNIGIQSEWGAAVRLARGASHNQILRNIITDTGRGGILANEGSTDLIIRGNRITGIGKVYGGLSIEVHTECNRAIIEDNVVEHWISLDKTNHSAIRRNRISTNKRTDWKYAALELAGGTNNVFTDNIADGGATMGISISIDYPKEYVFWGRNTFKRMADWGAQLQGDTFGLSYQYFYKNVFSDTYGNHDQSAYPDQGHGFRVNGNSHNITLEENIIEDNSGFGVEFNGSRIDRFAFINNTISGNILAAVTAYSGKDMHWSNNHVSGNGSDATPASSGFVDSVMPQAGFSSESTVEVHSPARFVNLSRSGDSGGSIAHVLWDFDDGLPSTANNPTHIYTKTGTYQVTLIAWDSTGRAAREEKTITVVDGTHSRVSALGFKRH